MSIGGMLATHYGPLPLWGWGAAAGGGLLLMKARGSGSRKPDGEPGQPLPHPTTTMPQNIGDAHPIPSFGYGLDAKIDASFFGNEIMDYSGPTSIPWQGFGDYSDVFPFGVDGHHRHHHHHRHSGRELHLMSMGIHDRDWVPVGSGGIGTHGPQWMGETAPAGGEGFHNHGQSYFPGQRPSLNSLMGWNNGFREHGGGVPHPQKTTMGAPLGSYVTQHGDTFDRIATKMWGPGANGTTMHQANPGLVGTAHDRMPAGHHVNIPSAPPEGLAPAGVSGSGVGTGSWMRQSRARGHGSGMNNVFGRQGTGVDKPEGPSARVAPGKAGAGNRGGRGRQKGRVGS